MAIIIQQKTFRLSGTNLGEDWHVLDAAGRPLGRVAGEAARLLLGKHKPTYEPTWRWATTSSSSTPARSR